MITLGVYSYVLWGELYRLPYKEMIKSVAPIADEIVIICDPRLNDSTYSNLKRLALEYKLLRVIPVHLDYNNPNIDGATKALARSFCSSDFLLQMDADEILREEDYETVLCNIKRMPKGINIISTSVINWFNGNNLKMSSAGWVKERITRNIPEITHGIPIELRKPYGIYYQAISGDGAGYIHAKTGEQLSGQLFLTGDIFNKFDYKSKKAIFIHHYSWYDLPRKWYMNPTWHYFWGLLNGKYKNLDDYKVNLDGEAVDFWNPEKQVLKTEKQQKEAIIKEMKDKSIKKAPKWVVQPEVMKDWIEKAFTYQPKWYERIL